MLSLFANQPGRALSGGKLPRWLKRSAGFVTSVGLAAVLLSTLTFVPTWAQMQQSGGGGSNASVGSFAGAAPGSGTAVGGVFNTTLPTYTNGQLGQVQVDANGRLLVASIAVTSNVSLTAALPAGSNAIGTVRINALTSCGNTVFDSGITTVPTTEAAATSTATCVQAIYVNNLTASSQTFSIKDNQGTPVVYVNGFNLPANSNMLLTFGGIKFSGGVRWVATNASAVNAQVLGYQ